MSIPAAVLPLPGDHPLVDAPQGRWTYANWEHLPDDGNRYEIIDGVLSMTTAPSFFHQWVVSRLIRYIGIPAEEQGLAVWTTAPIGVILAPADAVQPDFVVLRTEHADLVHHRRIWGAPDLVAEVLSPGNSAEEMREKHAAYARAGVPEYIIVHPATRTVEYYRLEAPGMYAAALHLGGDDVLTLECLPGITVTIAALFAGALDTEL